MFVDPRAPEDESSFDEEDDAPSSLALPLAEFPLDPLFALFAPVAPLVPFAFAPLLLPFAPLVDGAPLRDRSARSSPRVAFGGHANGSGGGSW
jgi:hypothetical protein